MLQGKHEQTLDEVGQAYDKWTTDQILETYWGEHIHLGWYPSTFVEQWESPSEDLVNSFVRATVARIRGDLPDFKEAKLVMCDRMLTFSNVEPTNVDYILDVGCGIGGTTRFLAILFPNAQVIGISLSAEQVARATHLSRHLSNCSFRVTNALAMPEEWTNKFSFVWACESGEHMSDKVQYVNEMMRVCKPSGKITVGTWCSREEGPNGAHEKELLDDLCEVWHHPYFISKEEYGRMFAKGCQDIRVEDWSPNTQYSWRHSIFVGGWFPWPVIFRPSLWASVISEIRMLECFHQAFVMKLMGYGMITCTKNS